MDLIYNHIIQGYQLSHILYINVLNAPSNEVERKIKEDIYIEINGVTFTKEVQEGFNAVNTWNTSVSYKQNSENYTYYYCYTNILGDVAIQKHTQLLLNEIMYKLDDKYDNIFTNRIARISFLILKPASLQLAII